MHVKEQVKGFVHDVKRKFSQKHKRDTSTSDGFDYSSADTHSHMDDSSSSCSVSSQSSSREHSRFLNFIRRTPSTSSKKHSVFRRARKVDDKRHRLFSEPCVPSARIAHPYKQPANVYGPSGSDRDMAGRTAFEAPQDYLDVIDVSARGSVATGTATPVEENTPSSSSPSPSPRANRDAWWQAQPLFGRESGSDTSGTLVPSSDRINSASGPESRLTVDSHSDEISEKVHDNALASPPVDPMASDPSPRDDEVTLVHSTSPPPLPPPPPPPPPRRVSPLQHARSSSASPAPVLIPRLTAPSMFLPIPNTDPLSALLTKYVPAEQRPRRDVVGEYAGRDLHEMVMSNSWRALAKMARDRIVASDPEDLGRILDLWSLRLSSLARLRLTNQASAECTNLFAVLNAVHATPVPGTFPGSSSLTPSTSLPSSPGPTAPSPLSPSGLSVLAQLPGTPSQKPSTLSTPPPAPAMAPRQGINDLLHPFELTVFHARVHYWSGDPLGYVDALSQILSKCKEKAREEGRIVMQQRELRTVARAQGKCDVESSARSEHVSEDEGEAELSTESTKIQGEVEEQPDEVLAAAEANLSMWLERIARVCLILASQMVETNDYQAAINLLAPLCTYRAAPTFLPTPTPTPALHSALARVYLISGNLQKAEEHFSIAASAGANSASGADIVAVNTALLATASGDWARAEAALSEMVAKDPGNLTAINNLAVTLLYQGRVKEGIDLLEAALKTSPSSVVVAEPFLFNLSTLYELRSTAAIDKKRGLLIQVAKWSGDGLRTSCLKMPSS